MKWLLRHLTKIHRWGAWLAALPSLLILGTGIVLALRQTSPWIQPPVQKGTPGIPTLALSKALEFAQSVPDAEIQGWKDIKSIEVKPAQGVFCFRANNGYEVQIDGVSGHILSASPRRTTWIIALHEGSYFYSWIRWGIFFPAGVILFFLSCTGVGLLVRPYLGKRYR
jgi:uncharacterized iron-regulated membrane protein